VESHGRNLKDPWSLRQSAVYQRYDCESGRSRFVIFQPSDAMYRQLREILQHFPSPNSPFSNEAIHSAFLWSSEANSREYINYLEREFRALVSNPLVSSKEMPLRASPAQSQRLRAAIGRESTPLPCRPDLPRRLPRCFRRHPTDARHLQQNIQVPGNLRNVA
jgi:hypothetical protein